MPDTHSSPLPSKEILAWSIMYIRAETLMRLLDCRNRIGIFDHELYVVAMERHTATLEMLCKLYPAKTRVEFCNELRSHTVEFMDDLTATRVTGGRVWHELNDQEQGLIADNIVRSVLMCGWE